MEERGMEGMDREGDGPARRRVGEGRTIGGPKRPLLVFSDLDGSLLNHDDYSWREASGALARLRESGVPLVLASSKTKAEMLAIRHELGNDDPFVVENGAAIYLPPRWPEEREAGAARRAGEIGERLSKVLLGRDRREVLEALHEIRSRRGFRFEGFADWDVERISEHTGLDAEAAAAAGSRDATEPLLWLDERHPAEELEAELASRGLRLVRGGRFLHAMGEIDKGEATEWLAERCRSAMGELITVAVGDSPNDLGMLRSAHVAIVIPRLDGALIDPGEGPRVIRADRPGAAGWQQGMEELFELLAALETGV